MLLCDSGYVNRVCFVLRSRFGRYRKAQAHPRHTAVRVGSTWARAKNREAEFVFTYKYQGTWCLIHGYQILDGLASSQASVGIHAMLTRGLGSYLVEKKKQRFFFFPASFVLYPYCGGSPKRLHHFTAAKKKCSSLVAGNLLSET